MWQFKKLAANIPIGLFLISLLGMIDQQIFNVVRHLLVIARNKEEFGNP